MGRHFAEVEFGGQKVDVPVGGYYDRFRMKPDLDEVARDPAAGNIDFFRRIPKRQVASRIGPTWAPNFYYRSSNIQLLFLAPIGRLRAMLPTPIEPLRALPGHGLVALTFFSYSVCDNDPYNKVSIAVVIRRPGARGSHALELFDAMRRRSFFAHVLALPVTTEIARVRGVAAPADVGFTNRVAFPIPPRSAAGRWRDRCPRAFRISLPWRRDRESCPIPDPFPRSTCRGFRRCDARTSPASCWCRWR